MGNIAVGSVTTIRFPFSDLSQSTLRPAVVLADASRGDWVLCQITSRPYGDLAAVKIEADNFDAGSLPLDIAPPFVVLRYEVGSGRRP